MHHDGKMTSERNAERAERRKAEKEAAEKQTSAPSAQNGDAG